METTAQQLRRVIAEIRRKPYPIKDLIPLLDNAATELEKQEARCLVKYLVPYLYKFVADDKGRLVIEEEVLYQLIKRFQRELP